MFLQKINKSIIFKKLLWKLDHWNLGDGCSIRAPISVIFSGIYVSETEEEIIAPMKPHFKKWYGDDTYIQRKETDLLCLFEKLNSSHPSIKQIIKKSEIETKVYKKSKKLPVHWSSIIPTKYKCNDISGDYIEL